MKSMSEQSVYPRTEKMNNLRKSIAKIKNV